MSGDERDASSSSAAAPSLRQYFGSPKQDDDVFSHLTDGSAMMASQANLTDGSAMMASQANLTAQVAPVEQPPLPPGPPTVPLVPEQAGDVGETLRHELQQALALEERRPRFSIGPEAVDELADTVAAVQLQAEAAADPDRCPSTAEVSVEAESAPQTPTAADTEADFGGAAVQQVEDVPLTDAEDPGGGGVHLQLPETPDDPGLSCEPPSPLAAASESDAAADAWIPPEGTRAMLANMSHSLPGTFYPQRGSLTLPGCSLQHELTDPVAELMVQHMSSAEARRRSVLGADSVTQDERGIRQLIAAGCYRAAVNLTGRLLANYGQGYGRVGQLSKHTANSVQLWFTRLALLVKLRQFSVAEREAQPWGAAETADLFYQYYPDLYGGRRGSLVPFSLRVLLAELPRYLGQYQASLDRLHALAAVCRQILANLAAGRAEDGSAAELSDHSWRRATQLWTGRRNKVTFSIANCCIGMKDYEQAVECLSALAEELPAGAAGLRSAVGRLYLQLGDLTAARVAFSAVAELQVGPNSSGRRLECQILTNQALLAVAENNYSEAQASFERALQLDPQNATLLTNTSVCLLYRGRLSEAVSMLETAVLGRPELLQETILLNLCTLYELQTSKCNQKKVALLARVGAHKGDGFNVGCLKLQSASQ